MNWLWTDVVELVHFIVMLLGIWLVVYIVSKITKYMDKI